METTSSFSGSRFALLFKRFWLFNQNLLLISIVGLVTAIFLLLFALQIVTNFAPWEAGQFIMLFIWIFMILAIIYAGLSFPGLRSKRASSDYLLTPTTTMEKFLFELVVRILLFIVIVPTAYWIIFQLEGRLVELINPDFVFQSFSFFDAFKLPTEAENTWMKIFTATEGLLFLTVPFYGATYFARYPIVKTLIVASIVLFFHLLFYYFVYANQLKLFPSRQAFLIYATVYLLAINAVMLVLTYFRIKNKQA